MMSAISLILAAKPTAEASAGTNWWAPAIVAAIVAAAVSLTTFGLTGRRDRIDRQRQVFADALDAIMTYREYPFIVYRRNPDDAAKERQRISSDLSQLQAKLNGLQGRLRVEDLDVGARFVELLAATRRIAGPMIIDAWNREPASADSSLHNPGGTSASSMRSTMATSARSLITSLGSRGSVVSGGRVLAHCNHALEPLARRRRLELPADGIHTGAATEPHLSLSESRSTIAFRATR